LIKLERRFQVMQEFMNINKFCQKIQILKLKDLNKVIETAKINIYNKLIPYIKITKLIKFSMSMKVNFCKGDLKVSSELLIIKADVRWDFGALK